MFLTFSYVSSWKEWDIYKPRNEFTYPQYKKKVESCSLNRFSVLYQDVSSYKLMDLQFWLF